jgi:hypothetical protein
VPRAASFVLVCTLVAVAGGCGARQQTATPAACLVDAGGYDRALERAPAQVLLEGRTSISDCLPREQGAGEIAEVGQTMVAEATMLNRTAQSRRGEGQALKLGYLVGGVSVGVAKSSGIHGELLRRIDSAAHFEIGGPLSAGFRRAYAKGYAAARRNG